MDSTTQERDEQGTDVLRPRVVDSIRILLPRVLGRDVPPRPRARACSTRSA